MMTRSAVLASALILGCAVFSTDGATVAKDIEYGTATSTSLRLDA
jgi:hypothetical protein